MEYNTRGTSRQGDELHLGYCQKTAQNISLCSVRIIHCFFVFGKLFILADRTGRNNY